MRVLAVTHVFPRAVDDSSAPFLLTWARALRDAGADVAVVAPHDSGLATRERLAGVPVLRVRYAPETRERLAYRGEMHQIALTPAGPPLVAGLLAAMARAVRAQARAGRPDLVHVHWWMPGAIVLRLAAVSAPAVCTVHGTDVTLIEQRPALAPVARWALARFDRVEAVSEDLADRLERATGRAADAVNPMPVDAPPRGDGADRDSGSSPGAARAARGGGGSGAPLRLLAVGRMVPEKGFADLVSAVAMLAVPAKLTIVGDGPELERLAHQAQALGVDLSLPGRLTAGALRDGLAGADIVVQPSHREGLGLVAVEALLAGTPTVATDSGGARDVLAARALVPPGDPAALAERIAAVAGDLDAERAAAIKQGGELRERFSPAAAAERTLAGYRKVAGPGTVTR
ncbi:MAG TPA: glycosyltransferase [Egibacteraceae bacterium]|nr:glycosyltransferase [Egibacteraceae bacterium]